VDAGSAEGAARRLSRLDGKLISEAYGGGGEGFADPVRVRRLLELDAERRTCAGGRGLDVLGCASIEKGAESL
jgi:hypothetical protein